MAADRAGNGKRHVLRRVAMASAGALAIVGAAAAVALAVAIDRIGPLSIGRADAVSVTVLDRQDRLLRAYTTPDGRWRLPIDPAEVDQRYLAMLQAYEDRRFRWHPGVDPIALARAAGQLVRHGRIVSGGSTLTMQVARLLEGEHERTASGKLRQIVRALKLERSLSKEGILALYLRLAPFGGNIEGVRAASFAYFGKEPRRLSVGEAALLVALPQSPELRRPDRHPGAARRARDRVLDRAAAAGLISATEARRAKLEPVPTARREFPRLAPHLADAEVAQDEARRVHRLTLDRDIQGQLETLARDAAHALGPKLSAALLAVDNRSGEVLAYVGSADYLDEERLGPVDMVRAVRSPGSTLKPIIYGLGFEAGLIHPETLIEDRPTRFGTYSPRNFDEEFHGTVSVRDALAQSLNIPAVKVLNAVGPARLMSRFRRVGLAPVMPGTAAEPTLAVALGGVGLRLADLTALYAGLARGGSVPALVYRRNEPAAPKTPARALLTPAASWYVTDILKDAPPPVSTKGGLIAYKTGTSYGYRDAWAIGYDGRHTVAVWIGRADGATTLALTGRTAAAPLLFDAFARLAQERTPLPPAPHGVLRATGANLPPPLKRFAEPGDEVVRGPWLEPPVQIAFPLDRSELEREDADTPIVVKAEGGALPLTWLVDGQPIAADGNRRELAWTPDGRGFARLSVIDAQGRVDRVTVRVK